MASLATIEEFLNIQLFFVRFLHRGMRKCMKNHYYRFDEYLIVNLTQDKWMITDNTDRAFDMLENYTWYYENTGYARTRTDNTLKYYHQLSIDQEEGLETDHINRHKFDNRTINLRLVTHSDNLKNRRAWKWKKQRNIL